MLDQLLVYHPSPWVDKDWARLSGLPLEDVWFDAADGTRLFGWYVKAAGSPGVLLWCHGNAGNIGHRVEWLEMLCRAGANVLIFDYRGYGRSEGRPFEAGLYRDESRVRVVGRRAGGRDGRLAATAVPGDRRGAGVRPGGVVADSR